MADNKLTATIRTEFGKGAARRARRAGKIPAVLYGHGTDPVHLNLPDHETFLIVAARPTRSSPSTSRTAPAALVGTCRSTPCCVCSSTSTS